MGCPSTQPVVEDDYMWEVWILFGIGTFVLILRTCVRLRTVGWRKFCGDDYMAIPVLICFLCDSVTITICYLAGTNLDYNSAQLAKMQPCQIDRIEIGSRMQLLAWYTYTALIWGLKAMMLFFFGRLTVGLTQQTMVKVFAVAVGVSYVVVFLTITCSCRPIQDNWRVVPLPSETCTAKIQNFYVTTVFNVLTDAAVLSIPIPLLWKLKIPPVKKVALGFLLCSGIFVIAAALLRITFSLHHVSAININRWGTRETFAGIVAVNMAVIRPIFLKDFWKRGPFVNQSSFGRASIEDGLDRRRDDSNSIQTASTTNKSGSIGTFAMFDKLAGKDGVDIEEGEKHDSSQSHNDSQSSHETHSRNSSSSPRSKSFASLKSKQSKDLPLEGEGSESDRAIYVETSYDVHHEEPRPPEPAAWSGMKLWSPVSAESEFGTRVDVDATSNASGRKPSLNFAFSSRKPS